MLAHGIPDALTLLHKVRVNGIEITYERFLPLELETSLSNQETTTYQTFQDSVALYVALRSGLLAGRYLYGSNSSR